MQQDKPSQTMSVSCVHSAEHQFPAQGINKRKLTRPSVHFKPLGSSLQKDSDAAVLWCFCLSTSSFQTDLL